VAWGWCDKGKGQKRAKKGGNFLVWVLPVLKVHTVLCSPASSLPSPGRHQQGLGTELSPLPRPLPSPLPPSSQPPSAFTPESAPAWKPVSVKVNSGTNGEEVAKEFRPSKISLLPPHQEPPDLFSTSLEYLAIIDPSKPLGCSPSTLRRSQLPLSRLFFFKPAGLDVH
jgi:hypothetical protein